MPDVSERPLRKQQQRSLVTQQKLLDAATEAFSENGFQGTSTRDIAERAGVHHPLITYHFKNKEQLWRVAADRIWRDFSESLSRAMAETDGSDPKAQMATTIRAYVRYAHNHPALHKVMVQESSYPNPRLDWLVATHLKPFFEQMLSRIEHLQAIGVAPRGNPALLFNMLRVSAGGLVALSLEIHGTSGVDLESGDTLEELSDMIIRLFLPGGA